MRITEAEARQIISQNRDYLRGYWESKVRTIKLYHATSNFSVPQIKRYGLAPGMKPPYYDDIRELHALLLKSGRTNPLNLFHDTGNASGLINQGFFLTGRYDSAKDYYDKRVPSIWFEYVKDDDYNLARKRIFMDCLFNKVSPSKNIPNTIYKEAGKLYTKDVGKCYDLMLSELPKKYISLSKEDITLLSKQEFRRVIKIFDRLWVLMKDSKSVMLMISPLAPALAPYFTIKLNGKFESIIESFEAFLASFIVSLESSGNLKDALSSFEHECLSKHQLYIKEWIQPKYIKIKE